MEMEQQRQLQEQPLHSGLLRGIARLDDPSYRHERHNLVVSGFNSPRGVNRRSVQHLVTVLDDSGSHEVRITELWLDWIYLCRQDDGGLRGFCDFFARSDTTLTKVHLQYCDFGTAQEASQLLAAFHTNRTVTDLAIRRIRNLEGDGALGTCISRLLQNMPQLQRLDCSGSSLRVEGVRVLRPALQANRTLRELDLKDWCMGDDGIHVLADALSGNTTMHILNIGANCISSYGLDGITRLLQSTRLGKISLSGNRGLFNEEAATQRFARILSSHGFLKDLRIDECLLGAAGIRMIAHGLVGNTTMEILDIGLNRITCVGLDDITRLVESTRLKSIAFQLNWDVFDDETATQRFVSTLQQNNSRVQELPGITSHDFPINIRAAAFTNIQHSLTRNHQMNHVNLLLAPSSWRPQQQQQQQRNAGGTMLLLKIYHKAITKFATVPNNAGASAIFKLFQARPALLETRLQRPAAGATVVSSHGQKRPRPF